MINLITNEGKFSTNNYWINVKKIDLDYTYEYYYRIVAEGSFENHIVLSFKDDKHIAYEVYNKILKAEQEKENDWIDLREYE